MICEEFDSTHWFSDKLCLNNSKQNKRNLSQRFILCPVIQLHIQPFIDLKWYIITFLITQWIMMVLVCWTSQSILTSESSMNYWWLKSESELDSAKYHGEGTINNFDECLFFPSYQLIYQLFRFFFFFEAPLLTKTAGTVLCSSSSVGFGSFIPEIWWSRNVNPQPTHLFQMNHPEYVNYTLGNLQADASIYHFVYKCSRCSHDTRYSWWWSLLDSDWGSEDDAALCLCLHWTCELQPRLHLALCLDPISKDMCSYVCAMTSNTDLPSPAANLRGQRRPRDAVVSGEIPVEWSVRHMTEMLWALWTETATTSRNARATVFPVMVVTIVCVGCSSK